MALTYKNCDPFLPLKDGDRATVLRIYDGDSLTLGWTDADAKNVRLPCRLRGIDTPELRGSPAHEKELALRARDRLRSKVLGKVVIIRFPGPEKYGRVLADLETDDCKSVADYMLEAKDLCRRYDGGKRRAWS